MDRYAEEKGCFGDMSDKPRVSYSDLAWAAAFARIEEGQKVSVGDIQYRVIWKHTDPDWLQLNYRTDKELRRLMVRKGDPLLLELRHE